MVAALEKRNTFSNLLSRKLLQRAAAHMTTTIKAPSKAFIRVFLDNRGEQIKMPWGQLFCRKNMHNLVCVSFFCGRTREEEAIFFSCAVGGKKKLRYFISGCSLTHSICIFLTTSYFGNRLLHCTLQRASKSCWPKIKAIDHHQAGAL